MLVVCSSNEIINFSSKKINTVNHEVNASKKLM